MAEVDVEQPLPNRPVPKPRRRRWEKRFLDALSLTPVVSAAARYAGVSTQACYAWRQADERFRELWDAALVEAVDRVETRGYQLASGGDAGMVRFILAKRRPELYGDRIVHTGADGGAIRHEIDIAELLKNPTARKALDDLSRTIDPPAG